MNQIRDVNPLNNILFTEAGVILAQVQQAVGSLEALIYMPSLLYQQAGRRRMHALVRTCHGSISAEHGVGQMRRDELRIYKNPVELELMMLLKQTLATS